MSVGAPTSRQVAWFEVYEYAARIAARHGVALDHSLISGTPQWCGLVEDDPRKLVALLLGGVRDALRNDTHQQAMAEASHAISAATDCAAIVRGIRRRSNGIYIPRRRA